MPGRYDAQRAAGHRGDRESGESGESGQALLELALVVPILVLLIMAIFQFAYVIQAQVGLTNAVREAARRVAATENPAPVWTGGASLDEWVQAELCGDIVGTCDGGLLDENVQAFDGARLWTDPPSVTFCRYSVDLAGSPTNQFRVEAGVQYKHPVFFGLLAYATDLVDGTPNGFWDLTATAQMRMENVDDTDPSYTDPGLCP